MKCKKCNKDHDGSYGSGVFCTQKCSRSYSTSKDNNNVLKESKCVICEKDIVVKKRSSNHKCVDCKKTNRSTIHKNIFENKCDFCGKEISPSSQKKSFCDHNC